MSRFGRFLALGWGQKYFSEFLLESNIDVLKANRQPKIDQTCDPVLVNAAGHDAAKMRQIRLNIDRKPVKRHPFSQPYAKRGDFIFGAAAIR